MRQLKCLARQILTRPVLDFLQAQLSGAPILAVSASSDFGLAPSNGRFYFVGTCVSDCEFFNQNQRGAG